MGCQCDGERHASEGGCFHWPTHEEDGRQLCECCLHCEDHAALDALNYLMDLAQGRDQ